MTSLAIIKIMITALLCLLFVCHVGGIADKKVIEQACRGEYSPGEYEYLVFVGKAIFEVATENARHGFSYLANGSSNDPLNTKCYAHGACNGQLRQYECSDCLKHAVIVLLNYCNSTIGAQTKLQDCQIRYENYPFDPNY